ncbi:hypothetical protein KUTeg_004103 [Tegillarca granosa]|uniref:PLAT domain-containing protein n=1 Tax=Tegillarca granosa TaxID=220873 RepID=A0ABQ9FP07_TEGGR|nr:hypothetical protein KUTeg_004103 [Tegillarca granosa]
MEDEVKQGTWAEYQVYVKTGNRIGASTKADVKLILYGEKGRTKEFLLEDSKRNKVKFQKGKEDLFILPAHHVGKLKKVKIGHDRTELSCAWFLEGVTVYDMYSKKIYDFKCEQWLSGQDGDRKTYRILPCDRDRAFLEEYDDHINRPRERKEMTRPTSGSSSDEPRRSRKPVDKYSVEVGQRSRPRPGGRCDDSDSSDSSSSSSSSSSYTTSTEKQASARLVSA